MKYLFTLFLAGQSSRNNRAILACVNDLLLKRLKGDYILRTVDVIDTPEQAIKEDIFVTPSWVRNSPLPRIKLVGNFCEEKNVSKAFDLFLEASHAR
jgi:circadian clock protein KaiB